MSLNTILATTPLVSTNYILKATGTTIGNSLIWDNGTNVGIGNTNTSYTLDVSGTGRFTSSLTSTEGIFSSGGVDGSLGAVVRISSTNTNGNARNWALVNTFESYGDLNFRISTAQGGNALTAGTTIMTLNRSGNVGIGTSSPTTTAAATTLEVYGSSVNSEIRLTTSYSGQGSSAGFSLISDSSSIAYVFNRSNAAMIFGTNNTERMRIRPDGGVNIGQTTGATNIKLKVRVADQSSSNYAFLIDNSITDLLEIRNDGYFNVGNAASSPYNYGATYNIKAAYLDQAGGLGYNGSTRESKINIITMDSANWINQLNPVTFNKRKKDDEGNFTDEYYEELHYGFIADEMETVNTDFVFYDEKDGEKKLAGIHYDRMIAPLVKAIQQLSKQNEELSNRLIKLESK